MKATRLLALLWVTASAAACAASRTSSEISASETEELARIRRELEAVYELNRQAILHEDIEALFKLRSEDFHAVTPDSLTHDRDAMRASTEALFERVQEWKALTFEIDSLSLEGEEVHAIVRQHADRMAVRGDGMVHHVQTWVVQRESWIRTPVVWKMRRVDQIRDQRRLVDGEPG